MNEQKFTEFAQEASNMRVAYFLVPRWRILQRRRYKRRWKEACIKAYENLIPESEGISCSSRRDTAGARAFDAEFRHSSEAHQNRVNLLSPRFFEDVLASEFRHRGESVDWLLLGRVAMLFRINRIRCDQGLSSLTIENVEKVELMAAGHYDYVEKFARYCSYLSNVNISRKNM